MRRFFTILLTALSMLTVALLSGFIAMRLAIHGREVTVPDLSGLSLEEASQKAGSLGLALRLENRFYSTMVPSGRIISQFPLPGAVVRREWNIRISESLGAQQVSIPDVVGQAERPASLAIRRLSLDLGTVAAIGAPGPSGIVLAQTPPPNAEGVDRPRVSLVLSQADSALPQAYVMPQLLGLSFAAASSRASSLGLHLVASVDPNSAAAESAAAPAPSTTTPSDPSQAAAPEAPAGPAGAVGKQYPMAGYRVLRGESVRVVLQ